jgi:hypothetical protein
LSEYSTIHLSECNTIHLSECNMILAKYNSIDGEASIEFHNIDDLTSSPFYDKFNYIDMSNMNLINAPSKWPKTLEILKCEKNRINKLENLPTSLRMLYARTNKIEEFPIVIQCTRLELIDVYDNNIVFLDKQIPNEVHTIDISFNKLKLISYHLIPEHVKITASLIPPEPFENTMIYDHNDIVMRIKKQIVTVTVYNDGQNVHASSVQSSANESLDIILKYESPDRKLILDEIHDAFKRYQRNKTFLFRILPGFCIPSLPLKEWWDCNTIHSAHGISYKTLLNKVWAIIQDHKYRQELEMILCEELDSSRDVCFTGRFTRTLNVLTGFVEGVQVGISSREQMQNQISKAIETCRKKYNNSKEFVERAKEMVGNILNEFSISEIERDAWLDAIE